MSDQDVVTSTPFDHGPPRVIDIFNGDDFLGSVCIGRSIRAVTPTGEEIGRFETVEFGRAAVVRAAYTNNPDNFSRDSAADTSSGAAMADEAHGAHSPNTEKVKWTKLYSLSKATLQPSSTPIPSRKWQNRSWARANSSSSQKRERG
jgi:hypothetical protein